MVGMLWNMKREWVMKDKQNIFHTVSYSFLSLEWDTHVTRRKTKEKHPHLKSSHMWADKNASLESSLKMTCIKMSLLNVNYFRSRMSLTLSVWLSLHFHWNAFLTFFPLKSQMPLNGLKVVARRLRMTLSRPISLSLVL